MSADVFWSQGISKHDIDYAEPVKLGPCTLMV